MSEGATPENAEATEATEATEAEPVDAGSAPEAPPAVAVAQDPAREPAVGEPAAASKDALFEALWARVLASWDEDKAHTVILEHALRSELLPELAGRYRAEKDVPGHEERAKKRLDAIVVAATQMLFAQRSPKADKPPWQLTAFVAVACVALLIWLALKVLR